MIIKDKEINKCLIVGLGYRTGVETANFLLEKGVSVYISDRKKESALADIIKSIKKDITLFTGDQSVDVLENNFDLIVLSPGVPKSIPLIVEAEKKGIDVISEIELASYFLKGIVIGITGTDGKSTTTTLVGEILSQLGFKTFVGGNIGIPVISFVNETDNESITVIELSSFQLETIKTFKPDISAILNIGIDHMDRYNDLTDYFKAKLRILENQKNDDYYIFNFDDKMINNKLEKINMQKRSFSMESQESAIFFNAGLVYRSNRNESSEVLDTLNMKLIGLHNVENAMAAILMVEAVLEKKRISIDYIRIAEAIYSFSGLKHRMESIGFYDKREFINDSKATTVGAVKKAILSLTGNTIVILGGRAKGDDYSKMNKFFKNNIKGLVLIGETSSDFEKFFDSYKLELADSMYDALEKAYKMSGIGDTILLSPACASFDMYSSYEERGNDFKKAFKKLSVEN
jgi:UDP-N-acetylmuramoylalanine--D-glutamate ligase